MCIMGQAGPYCGVRALPAGRRIGCRGTTEAKMARSEKAINVKRANGTITVQAVGGFTPVQVRVADLPEVARVYLAEYGCSVVFQRLTANVEAGDALDAAIRAKAAALAAGQVGDEKSVVTNWELLFEGVARVTSRTLADVRLGMTKKAPNGQPLPNGASRRIETAEWEAMWKAPKVQQAMAAILQERADAAVAASGDDADATDLL